MKRILNRIVCLCLSVILCLPACLGVLSLLGIEANAAVSSSYTSELWLKTDFEYCLVNGEKYKMHNASAPYAYETGTVYVPISALCKYTDSKYVYDSEKVTVTLSNGVKHTLYIGKTEWSGGDFLLPVVQKDSEIYLSILSGRDVFGLKSSFYNDEIGLVILSKAATLKYDKTYSSLSTQIDTLSNLLFERPTGTAVFRDLVSKSGSAKTHPRILADQETFDELALIASGTETLDESIPEKYVLAVQSYANRCKNVYASLFTEDENGEVVWLSESVKNGVRQPYYIYDENGNRLVGQSTYSYVNEDGETVTLTCAGSGKGDGYDVGGRSGVDTQTLKLKSLAFAWQMTGEKKYADAFYLLAVEIGKWEHWGEGHFLDVADGSVEFAIGFDWIYHAFDDEPQKRKEIASILFEKGLMMGYYSILFDSNYKAKYPDGSYIYYDGTEKPSGSYGDYIHVSTVAGASSGWRTINRGNNWQTVCGSGMIISALALMEYTEYSDEAKFVIQSYLRSNEKCLLQYAPDGSYIESPGYWGYGTNTLVLTLAALESSCGTDYGLGNIVGLHDSFYFAIGIADSDYKMWNYHDSGNGGILDYGSFYFMSDFYGDPTLAALRDKQLFEREQSLTLMDILYYDPTLSEGADSEDLPFDYNFLGIDSATFRSSWDSEALFTGLHAGPGSVTHGDMDCGNFTLTMGGVNWILEPGTEDYNVKDFWSSGLSGGYRRYKLYGKSVEGHSTVVIRDRSVAFLGQVVTTYSTDYPRINTFYSDEYGGYAVTDMKAQYGSNCTEGLRGLLLTNSRSTVVLQDQITFSKATPLTAVYNLTGAIEIADDGRSLTSTVWQNGEERVLRMTLLSDDENLKFEKMKSSETIFSDTVIRTDADDKGHLYTKQRVVIKADYVTDYNVAVVFEMLRHEDEIVGYNKIDITDWQTCSDEWVKDENSDIQYEKPSYKYQLSDFVKAVMRLENAKDEKEFGEIIRETYIFTTDYDTSNKNVVKKVEEYMGYVNEYLALVKKYNAMFKTQFLD